MIRLLLFLCLALVLCTNCTEPKNHVDWLRDYDITDANDLSKVADAHATIIEAESQAEIEREKAKTMNRIKVFSLGAIVLCIIGLVIVVWLRLLPLIVVALGGLIAFTASFLLSFAGSELANELAIGGFCLLITGGIGLFAFLIIAVRQLIKRIDVLKTLPGVKQKLKDTRKMETVETKILVKKFKEKKDE